MIWVVLAFLGVPLWLLAAGVLLLVVRHRKLSAREGNMADRLHGDGKPAAKGWRKGNAVWVGKAFAFRGWPAAWDEVLMEVGSLTTRAPSEHEGHALRKLDEPVVVVLTSVGGTITEVAGSRTALPLLRGPFGATAAVPRHGGRRSTAAS